MVYLVIKQYHYLAEDENGQEIGWRSNICEITGCYRDKNVALEKSGELTNKLNECEQYDCDPYHYYSYGVVEIKVE